MMACGDEVTRHTSTQLLQYLFGYPRYQQIHAVVFNRIAIAVEIAAFAARIGLPRNLELVNDTRRTVLRLHEPGAEFVGIAPARYAWMIALAMGNHLRSDFHFVRRQRGSGRERRHRGFSTGDAHTMIADEVPSGRCQNRGIFDQKLPLPLRESCEMRASIASSRGPQT